MTDFYGRGKGRIFLCKISKKAVNKCSQNIVFVVISKNMNKVQLTLTSQEVNLLESFGSQFGYGLTKTIKYIISKASEKILQQDSIPTYEMSEETEKKGLQALEEYRSGKTIKVSNAETFFEALWTSI